ncbi:hypothetical protein [Yersinia pekkanenii]|uniref:Uncharacterized protein n=1 Tax=Yersinia pekkanenii TaxID=1288385 RepID=A0A0T9PZC1_9GAMM|nr:hypothetical protein [Yersinia pekkanenii]CNH88948.1 Uncharacterised protein [Yersinia pekkanenii]CRY67817.1 Uncharacterised protein [Yersinia pekkanenii]
MSNKKPTQIEIINDLLSQMNEEDANKYMTYINEQDVIGINSISKKYGYMYVTPISNIISDEMMGDLFGGKEDVFIPLFMDSLSNAAIKIKENGGFSREKHINQVGSISELRALDESINDKESANQYISAIFNEELNLIMKANIILKSAGCDYISSELDGLIDKMTIKLFLDKPLQAIKQKEIISEDRRRAGKGNINPHKSTAIEIMKNTWEKIPSASKNRMGEKLIEYFGKDVSGKNKVSSSSIKRWIKTNNLGPSIQASSPIDFSLVIRS